MATDARERLLADLQFGAANGSAVSLTSTYGTVTYVPATWYLGLSLTVPNDDGTNFTEPTGGSYARLAVTNNPTNFAAAVTTSGVTTKANNAAFTFTNPTGNWGQILYYGWFTASGTGVGLPEYHNPIDTGITINSGNTPVQFAAGQLVMPWT